MRIVFMGTPGFAVPSLEILVNKGWNVVAVVTAPDKPSGRGQKTQFSEVKEAALKLNIPVMQPEKLKAESFIEELKSFNADLQVVVAFRMLPEVIWKMPPLGTFNLHASLLPQYRGAAPINWAIINGEKETGVTTFFLQHEIDTGDLIYQSKTPIHESDNAGTLHDRLMTIGAILVEKTVHDIDKGIVKTTPQKSIDLLNIHHAPKIFKPDCVLDINLKANQVRNKIRGLAPYPGAILNWNEKSYKVYDAKVLNEIEGDEPVISDGKKFLALKCEDHYLSILEIQPENKKKMKIEEFLNGYKAL
ncbi:MAG: methionyl-tRNA formyltransferase [Cytophagales bacterium]